MKNSNTLGVPEHLDALLKPTPSSVEKLLCAWDCLSGETQIFILSNLRKIGTPPHLMKKIRSRALDSSNAYIRYLAAREMHFENDCTDEERVLKTRIENDPAPLVKYSVLEDSLGWTFFSEKTKDTELFFAQPQEARLAQIRSVHGIGESVARLISDAAEIYLKDGSVSETEIYEILSDYLMSSEFEEQYNDDRVNYDGSEEYYKGKDIESLWRLVPKLPISVSFLLIDKLPERSGLASEIPQGVIEAMTDTQLARLLYRKDIKMKNFRHELFWRSGKQRRGVINAAISSNFDIDYPEFYSILKKPPEDRVSTLKDLGFSASQLSLCLYEAIHDCLVASEASLLDFQDAIYPREHLERRINELKGERREKQLTELRLYREAKTAVPWDSKQEGYPPYGELEFLSENVFPQDTWLTFMEFSKTWSKNSHRRKNLDKYLPRIYELGEEDLVYEDTETDSPPDESFELIRGIDNKLTELQNIVQFSDHQEGKDWLEGLEHIRSHAVELSAHTQNQVKNFHVELKKLESSVTRQNFLLYASIGLIAWLLWLQF
jgi:hypothetical protein